GWEYAWFARTSTIYLQRSRLRGNAPRWQATGSCVNVTRAGRRRETRGARRDRGPLTVGRSQGRAELGSERGPAAGGEPERAAVADPDDPLAGQREVGDRGADPAGDVRGALAPVQAGADQRPARPRLVGEGAAVVGEPAEQGGGGGEAVASGAQPVP